MGGADAAARLTGVGTEAVRKWRQSRAIPSRHWPAVIAATGVSMADLQSDPSNKASLTMPHATDSVPVGATAVLVLADGSLFWGRGFGAHTPAAGPVGEVCFNTGMTGYQETLTDPSYAGQIITFTFPAYRQRRHQQRGHRGRDHRRPGPGRKAGHHGTIQLALRPDLDAWLRALGVTGMAGVDTRALTTRIREAARRPACWHSPPTGGSI